MKINLDVEGYQELIDFIKNKQTDLEDGLNELIRKHTIKTHDRVEDRINNQTTDNSLTSRTGDLKRSIQFSVDKNKKEGKVFTRSIYAPIHEKGGIIRAKKAYKKLKGGPFLNIPTNNIKTKAGVVKYTSREVFNDGGYIVKIKNHKKAQYMILYKNKPAFWLVKQVEIKARLGMLEIAQEEGLKLYRAVADLIEN